MLFDGLPKGYKGHLVARETNALPAAITATS